VAGGVANAAGLLGTPLLMIPGVDFAGIVVSDGDHAGQEAPSMILDRRLPSAVTLDQDHQIAQVIAAASGVPLKPWRCDCSP
jgi:hypothetical protein